MHFSDTAMLFVLFGLRFLKLFDLVQSSERKEDPYDSVLARDKSNWIDPHSISTNERSKFAQDETLPKLDPTNVEELPAPDVCQRDELLLPYFKHYVAGLLLKLNFGLDTAKDSYFKTQNETKYFDARIALNKYYLDSLTRIIQTDRLNAKLLSESLEAMDKMLLEVGHFSERSDFTIEQSIFRPAIVFLNSWLFRSFEFLILLSLLFTTLRRCSWRKLFCLALLIFFGLSTMQTWYRLSKEREAEYIAKSYRNVVKHCLLDDVRTVGYLSRFWTALKSPFSFTEPDKCAEYHKSINVEPFLEITPLYAVSVTLTEFVLAPFKLFGQSMGHFFADLFRHSPITLWPFIVGSLGVLLLLLLFFLSGYKLNLLYGLVRFEPSDQNERLVRAVVSRTLKKSITLTSSDHNKERTSLKRLENQLSRSKSTSVSDLRLSTSS